MSVKAHKLQKIDEEDFKYTWPDFSDFTTDH